MKTTTVYLVDYSDLTEEEEKKVRVRDWPDSAFILKAQAQGNVYSLEQFEYLWNEDYLDYYESIIRIITE